MLRVHPYSSLLVLLAALGAGPEAAAQSPDAHALQEGAKKLAERVSQIAPKDREVVVSFTRKGGLSDIGIVAALGKELETLDYRVVKAGTAAANATEVNGEMKPYTKGNVLAGYDLNAVVEVDQQGKVATSARVENKEEALQRMGVTVVDKPPPIPNPGPAPGLDKTVPVVRRVEWKVQAHEGNPYGVRILSKKSDEGEFEPCPVMSSSDGKNQYIYLEKGDIVAVELSNDTNYEAAAEILIDGVTRFALARDVAHRGYVNFVRERSVRRFFGYYLTSSNSNQFVVGRYPDSVAAKLRPDSLDVGTITVSFAAAWMGNQRPPLYEERAHVASEEIGMAAGKEISDNVKLVKKKVGEVRTVITIRYLSRGTRQ